MLTPIRLAVSMVNSRLRAERSAPTLRLFFDNQIEAGIGQRRYRRPVIRQYRLRDTWIYGQGVCVRIGY